MMHLRQQLTIIALTLSTLVWSVGPVTEAAASVCTPNPDEMPPFLATAVDPNLLLMIDNSASMFDLAYVAEAESCFDDTYDSVITYAGYFEPDAWYAYEGGRFVVKTDGEAGTMCSAASHLKTDGAGGNHICLTLAADEFQSLAAKGNFLNWVAASKLDIEKKILTGGKYEDGNLVMESRGCLERRFVKQTTFDDGYYLTMAVRKPNADEQATVSDLTSRIEIFPVTDEGYDYEDCRLPEDTTMTDLSLGSLKGWIDACMDYPSGGGNTPETASRSAFNHSVQDCWYMAKHGLTQWISTNGGSITRVKNDCSAVYDALLPWDVGTDHSGYVCFGDYRKPVTDPLIERGYVGRCWDDGAGAGGEEVCTPRACTTEPVGTGNPRCIDGQVHQCDGNYNANQDECKGSPGDFVPVEDCTGGGSAGDSGWMSDLCIQQGLIDFCGTLDFPEVVDPSDQVGGTGDDTGEFWNLPAMMVDIGISEQLGEPLVVMSAKIEQPSPPSGLLQEFAADLRIGAMVFNRDGAKSECLQSDPYVTYSCADDTIKDGGRVIVPIGKGEAHTQDLVNAVNNIIADAWTPMAETMYNAIGYYTQRSDLRLHDDDFTISADADPVTEWCQKNNILLITDGAPTADQNETMMNFAEGLEYDLGGGTCEALHGSTYLNDLAKYAFTGEGIFSSLLNGRQKKNIRTHIVAAGTPRNTGENDPCSPHILMPAAAESGGTTLYQAANPEELEDQLRRVLENIRAGAAAGSAASVISASRTGEGAVYQAIFWPQRRDDDDNTVVWVGEVHALFVDAHGRMFEDTNGDKQLNPGPNDDDDQQVTIFFDENEGLSKACYGTFEAGCDEIKDIADVEYVWSANGWLSGLTDEQTLPNHNGLTFTNRAAGQRYIFTWFDLGGDGKVQTDEVLPFEAGKWDVLPDKLYKYMGAATEEEGDRIINWLRGADQDGMRSRKLVAKDDAGNDVDVTWRLGDVIHSTPTAVSRPAEGYHFLYQDDSYAKFAAKYNNRRHVIYFGANDGMLHAVNSGFYNDSAKKFCTAPVCGNESAADLPLGAELWAYVPYNLLPHLKCLTDPGYGQNGETHKYFVDQVPRIFDVQIFDEETACSTDIHSVNCIHPDGWGTILVGGMRFGGTPVTLTVDGEERIFTSAYFVLDITNPEAPPELLGELTYTGTEANMGYTTVVPTMVPMVGKGDQKLDSSKWYLVLGSGPTDPKGISTQPGKLAVIDLDYLVSKGKPFRIPDQKPGPDDLRGRFLFGDNPSFWTFDQNSFVSDPITVDYGLTYFADAVYFGTVSGNFAADDSWNGGGKLYRLVTFSNDFEGQQRQTTPDEWGDPLLLLDAEQPITAAPSVGSDGRNYWIYFGTGRLFNNKDKKDFNRFEYYGIKEPRDCNGFTWGTVSKGAAYSPTGQPGNLGLVRVDQIQVTGHPTASSSLLSCKDGTNGCLDWWTGENPATFVDLRDHIAGKDCPTGDNYLAGRDGWYRELDVLGERNLGQATLLGGLTTFTSYLPSTDVCQTEGSSYLYVLYYQTGTPWHRMVLRGTIDGDKMRYREDLGAGLAITPNLHVGTEDGAQAFVQTSTGAIVSIKQEETATDNKTGRASWRECD